MNCSAPVPTQPRPDAPAVMRQRWENLLFLHWKWDPKEIQRTLPQGLTVDAWNGDAWLGLVPFYMRGVRPVGCPPVPWLSDFLELNVRTYVRDADGRPGVWFYSLDCNQPVAVWLARTFFHLPYWRASMQAEKLPDGSVCYCCRRSGSGEADRFTYRADGPESPALSGTLEEFLVERYRLFSIKRSRIYSGQVWHVPYQFAPAILPIWSAHSLELEGFNPLGRPPDHAVVSSGVDVLIYPLRRN